MKEHKKAYQIDYEHFEIYLYLLIKTQKIVIFGVFFKDEVKLSDRNP